VSFWSLAVATAILSSGLALVVNPPVTAVVPSQVSVDADNPVKAVG
jgi:hypothetical protein